MYIHHVFVLLTNVLARSLRTILNNDHLEVLDRLMGQALQEFVHLVGAVEHRNNDGILHVIIKLKK